MLVAGYTGPPELTVQTGLTSWMFDIGGAVMVLVLGGAYLLGLRRLRQRGERWSPGRTIGFVFGLLVIVFATMSFLGVYSRTLFWVTAVQIALFLTVVPVLLSLGAPLSLLSTASPPAGARVDRVLESAPGRLLTFPVVACFVVAMFPLVVYYTPWFEATLRVVPLAWVLHAVLLGVGCLFYWTVLAVDRPPPLHHAALVAIVLVETFVDAIPGVVLWLGTTLIAPEYYIALGRPWGRSLLSDQQFGGIMLWAIGELVGLPLLLLVIVQWIRADAREAQRIDEELDRAEDEAAAAEVAAEAAMRAARTGQASAVPPPDGPAEPR
jgi:cytochrome c oxidase assembly factor CtaG